MIMLNNNLGLKYKVSQLLFIITYVIIYYVNKLKWNFHPIKKMIITNKLNYKKKTAAVE